jgi:hypothetical protein
MLHACSTSQLRCCSCSICCTNTARLSAHSCRICWTLASAPACSSRRQEHISELELIVADLRLAQLCEAAGTTLHTTRCIPAAYQQAASMQLEPHHSDTATNLPKWAVQAVDNGVLQDTCLGCSPAAFQSSALTSAYLDACC